MFLRKVKTKLLVALTLLSLGLLAGCTGDSATLVGGSVGTPNPNTNFPTGTIQGILKDNCTGQPIRNAIINIGVAQAVTDSGGQYVLYNVPATDSVLINAGLDISTQRGELQQLANSGQVVGNYSVTIDMRNATNPAGVRFAAGTYPDFTYDEVHVTFAFVADASGNNGALGLTGTVAAGSNHDTPVNGIASGDQDFYVGKTSGHIKGEVRKSNGVLVPNAWVQLKSLGHHFNISSATGFEGHLVAEVQADANGVFQFDNTEAGQEFKIVASDVRLTTGAFPTLKGRDSYIEGPCDNQFKLLVQDDAIVVYPTADICPVLLSSTPINNIDLDPKAPGNNVVTFTLSAPIKATALNSELGTGLTASNANGLYNFVNVQFGGNKKGNIAHTITTNLAAGGTTFTQIIVTIPNLQPAGKYSVTLEAGAASLLKDVNGKQLSDDAFSCSTFTDKTVHFTTFGAVTATPPTDLHADNTPYDYNSTIVLDWTPTVGPKSYNIYCSEVQWNGSTGNVHQAVLIDNVNYPPFNFNPTNFSGLFPHLTSTFVENYTTKITWNCFVRGVNADGIEGGDSNHLDGISDTVSPFVTNGAWQTTGPGPANVTSIVVTYDEFMDGVSVRTNGNYSFIAANWTGGVAPTTIDHVDYNVGTKQATVFFAAPVNFANVSSGTVKNIFQVTGSKDVAGNSLTGNNKFTSAGGAPNP